MINLLACFTEILTDLNEVIGLSFLRPFLPFVYWYFNFIYGEGFTKTNLYNYIGFYQSWPDFFHAVSGKSINENEDYFHAVSGKNENIVNALRAKSPIRLSWTHYRIMLQENSKKARECS